MIMPVGVVPNHGTSFRGAVKVAKPIDEFVRNFSVAEKKRFFEVRNIAEQTNDNIFYDIYENIRKIGKTIIKSVVIEKNKGEIIKEDVFSFTKGGSVYLLSREAVARTIIETLEGIYKK